MHCFSGVPARLYARLSAIEFFHAHELHWVAKTASTNDDLKAGWLSAEHSQQIRVADFQTAGRGQYGRRWRGGAGQALMFSFTAVLTPGHFAPSLLAGIALAEAVKSFELSESAKIWLKWPNDVWLADRKLAGILTESCLIQGKMHCIIGVGLNLLPLEDSDVVSASLFELAGSVEPSDVLCRFCHSWNEHWKKTDDQLAALWAKHAGNFWKTPFRITCENAEYNALPISLSSGGGLVVRDEDGNEKLLVSASLKPLF